MAVCDRDGTGWLRHHPNLVVLAVPDEAALMGEHDTLLAAGLEPVVFWEPDVAAHTALAVRPDTRAVEALAHLSLAGRPEVVAVL